MEAPKTDPALGPLANKLIQLRWLKRRETDGEQLDIGEIAEGVSRLYAEDNKSLTPEEMRAAGRTDRDVLNRQYLSDMLNGKRRNPSKHQLEYLARFFGVSPAYFFEGGERNSDTAAAEGEIEGMVALRQLRLKLQEGGAENPEALVMAFARGTGELDANTATGMIHMYLAAIDRARRGESTS
ncbi:helix-turn-helix transcriptional regulator [Streptomyces sp. NPDC088752]|uniref:helix-turn-helix domain-containing protein n=1 Tax=Streptomyces sp. NPDC088752 TaxID=3154963 RepID=UPI00342A0184